MKHCRSMKVISFLFFTPLPFSYSCSISALLYYLFLLYPSPLPLRTLYVYGASWLARMELDAADDGAGFQTPHLLLSMSGTGMRMSKREQCKCTS